MKGPKVFNFFCLILLAFLVVEKVGAEPRVSAAFGVPRGLEHEVRFWRAVFGTYGDHQIIFYDEKFLNVIYEVIDFSGLSARQNLSLATKQHVRKTEINQTMGRIAQSLKRLAAPLPDAELTAEEKYYQKMFEGVSEKNLREAPRRIRVQPGQRDHLRRAIAKAEPWMGDIAAIFESKGLPQELTALMFVESMFNPKALSEVGASGLWQFMPATGRAYVAINDFWDDRNDTLHASEGAADFLKDLYGQMGDWTLAVNAYHSGPMRILKAMKTLGTIDIATIVHDFKDPAYGFYSRNYVPEFLAIVGIYQNRAQYFAALEADNRQYDIVKTADFVILPQLAARFGMDITVLKKLNTALKDGVWRGDLPLPPHYHLKVPRGSGYSVAEAVGSLR